jgi:hypothetical protein
VSPSYASGTLTGLHFGLDSAETADVEVRWPDGRIQKFAGVAARKSYRLAPRGELRAYP